MSKKRKFTGPSAFFAIIAGGILLLSLVLGGMWFLKNGESATVVITQPSMSQTLTSGQGMMLVAEGRAEQGVQRIEFYVNDILESQQIAQKGKEDVFQAAFPWFGSQTGIQKLSMIAYDVQGKASAPASILVAVEAVQVTQLASMVVEDQGAEEESEGTGSQLGEIAADGQDQSREDDVTQGSEEAAPPEGREDADSGDITQGDGQQNHLQELPPFTTMFGFSLREGNGLNVSGSISASDDTGLEFAYYVIYSNGQPVEDRTKLCLGALNCSMDYDFSFTSGEYTIEAGALDTAGQFSEPMKMSYQVMNSEEGVPPAFVISEDFDANDIEVVNDVAQQQEENASGDYIGNPSVVGYRCSGNRILVAVDYRYVSNHGNQVYVGAWAEKGDTMVAAGHTPVEQNTSGLVRFELEVIAPDIVDGTEQLELHFMTPDGEYFYIEVVDMPIIWTNPKPDLRIADAGIKDGKVHVTIHNMGCWRVDEFNIKLSPSEAGAVTKTIDQTILNGEIYEWFPEINTSLFVNGFEVFVDPDNIIAEINEENNSYVVWPLAEDPSANDDGISDGDEVFIYQTPPNDDGISDGDEVFIYQTDLNDDGDGISDGDEVFVYQTDPNSEITDGDEVFVYQVDPNAEHDDIGVPHIAGYQCSGHKIILEVPYTYVSHHGNQIYVGAWAEKNNIMVAAGHSRIEHGSRIAHFVMEPIAPDLVDTTEQLELYFMTPNGEYFYIDTVNITISWPVPLPDLHILDVTRSENGETIHVNVKNSGCAPINNSFVIALRDPDGNYYSETFEENIPSGTSKTFSIFVQNPDQYSQAFQVIVDYTGTIQEINEGNNLYSKGAN